MCLGIPMQILEIHTHNARCSAKGIERDVSLFMMTHENLQVGDFVIVHVGYAIQKVDTQVARDTWALLDEISLDETP
jgi:hydrogenase expression/formation protein HypC